MLQFGQEAAHAADAIFELKETVEEPIAILALLESGSRVQAVTEEFQ